MKKLILALTAVALALPASAQVQPARRDQTPLVYPVYFGTGLGVDQFTTPIDTCPTMEIKFFQSTAAVVSVYETDPDDVTLAAIEAGTLVKQFSATTSTPHVFRPGKMQIRFVVDTAESSGVSRALVTCVNALAKADTIYRWPMKAAGTTNVVIGSSSCFFPWADGDTPWTIDSLVGCTAQEVVLGFTKDTLVTGMASTIISTTAVADRGCTVCLSTNGTSCDTGTIHNFPQDNDTPAAGDVYTTTMSVFYPAGSIVKPMLGQQNPGECETPSGGVCFCSASHEVVTTLDALELL